MPFPNPDTQFKKGESGNPAGRIKGRLTLSTHIQNILNDEDFEAYIPDARDGFIEYKGAPIKAILKALSIKAAQGDTKAFDALAKYGYGTKIEVEHSGEIATAKTLSDEELNERIQQYINHIPS